MIYEFFAAPFADYGFMRRALAGCLALSAAAPPVGVLLMLRRMSLTGDAISHGILPGVALGYLVAGFSLFAMTLAGLAAGLAVALMATLVARTTVQREDASLAAFYLVSLALGVLLISTRGSNVDLTAVLFGTVLGLDDAALITVGAVATVTLAALALILRPLVIESLDPAYLRAISGIGSWVHVAFMVLVVLNLVAGFTALGTLLSVGLMILPAVTARFWTRDLTAMLWIAPLAALASCLAGLLLSFHADLPSGPSIILCAGGLYALSMLVGRQGAWFARWRRTRHLQA
jgi:zinc/manganese transport system permease protein